MTTTEEKLKAICAELLKLNEDELIRFLPTYHRRLDSFGSIKEWEEATIIFFLINGLRIKNIQLPEKIKEFNSHIRLVEEKLSREGKNPLEDKGTIEAEEPLETKGQLETNGNLDDKMPKGQILNESPPRMALGRDSSINTRKPSLRLVK
jgi:hypothetical protein